MAVLHTDSRKLDFHPHVHVAMPAAALDTNKGLWRTLRKTSKGDGYFFNHKALAKVFRAKFLAAVAQAGLQLPPDVPDAYSDVSRKNQPDRISAHRVLWRGSAQNSTTGLIGSGKTPVLAACHCNDGLNHRHRRAWITPRRYAGGGT